MIGKVDWVKCERAYHESGFTEGCEYQIIKFDSRLGVMTIQNDRGERCLVSHPHDINYGEFRIID